MRILFDSKLQKFKEPFGALSQGQVCTLHIHIPLSVGAVGAEVICCPDWSSQELHFPLCLEQQEDPYAIYAGQFSLPHRGLYFYYFRIFKKDGSFRLFKQGDDTNMEAGDCWQLTCTPEDFTTPDWAKGAVIYQIFPDRFYKQGECDLTGKLEPYTVHEDWHEDVHWEPNEKGEVLNNDFYGGNFQGIIAKMDYIASLGTSIIYLNPISKSFSNHRYDTGDYKTPDPMLGTEEDFAALCECAHSHGIRIILDGVYSHTGSDSLYFDRYGSFGGKEGAFCNPQSPYRSWYRFHEYPKTYDGWWGFDTLPTVNKMDPSFLDYIIRDEDSVVAHWLRLGADGFRLDVADELPNEFLLMLKQRIREIKPDAFLIGEVWEDASLKESYGERRRYFTDGVLDSCMNYPFRTAVINFLHGWDDGRQLRERVMTIAENYPPQVLCCNMNCLSTHDTPRIITTLVDNFEGTREQYAKRKLSRSRMDVARDRLFMASFLQYVLPGAPSIYYGDETGMEGHKDPFNRRPYLWGWEDEELVEHFRHLGELRKQSQVLRLGDIHFFEAGDRKLGFTRSYGGKTIKIYVNRSGDPWEVPYSMVLFGHSLYNVTPTSLSLAPMGFCITEEL